jgi:hypothetical protein
LLWEIPKKSLFYSKNLKKTWEFPRKCAPFGIGISQENDNLSMEIPTKK